MPPFFYLIGKLPNTYAAGANTFAIERASLHIVIEAASTEG
jgi:hypothetical protein